MNHGFVTDCMTLGKSQACGPPFLVCKQRITIKSLPCRDCWERKMNSFWNTSYNTVEKPFRTKYNMYSLNSCFLPFCNWSKSVGPVSFWGGSHHPCHETFSQSVQKGRFQPQTQRNQERRGEKALFPNKGVSLIPDTVLLPPANSNQPHSLSAPMRAWARVEGFYTP